MLISIPEILLSLSSGKSSFVVPPQFFIGVSPTLAVITLLMHVPKVFNARIAPPFVLFIPSLYSLVSSINASLFAREIVLFPLSTIAFNFLDPITAPRPDLAAILPLSLTIPDINESFSPA